MREADGRGPATHAEWLSHSAQGLGARLVALVSAALPDERAPFPAGWPSAAPVRPADVTPLERLSTALKLTPVERDLVLLAGLPDDHEAWAATLRLLHPRGEPRPTVGLAAQLVCRNPAERWLLREQLETGAATREGVLRLSPPEAPFFELNLSLAPGLWSALGGLDGWPAAVRERDSAPVLFGLERWSDTAAVTEACRWLRESSGGTLLVTARDEELAFERAAALAHLSGRAWVGLRASAMSAELEQRLTVMCAARGVIPVLAPPSTESGPLPALPAFERAPCPVVLAVREGQGALKSSRPVLTLNVTPLPSGDRAASWRASLPELAEHAGLLSGRFSLEPYQVKLVGLDVRAQADLGKRAPQLEDVARSVRARANLGLGAGVQLVTPRATWADLVLPDEAKAKLGEAVARLEHQVTVLDRWGYLRGRAGSRGVRLLFCGPPGTGKSLSAEVLASALGVDLLWVDVSRVVSKWLGETEKNLSSVFDAAERAQAVLFFDEADALFASRTRVADAHDRYANLETGYLLSRLERFEGLTVLATNLKDNIDPAFVRRLEFLITFDEPDAERRLGIWRAHIPANAPLAADVNLDELATLYPLSGGHIRNAVAAAGFQAAADGQSLGRHHLLQAIRREFHKAGRLFPGEPTPR